MNEMEKFDWNDKLSVGYNNIDIQHKKLLLIINRFADLFKLSNNEYKANIGKVLKDLADYTEYHFEAEEKIMSKYEYPALDEHSRIHTEFIKKVNNSLKLLAAGDIQTGIEFYNFLGSWLIQHICITDQLWANYIAEKYPDEKF